MINTVLTQYFGCWQDIAQVTQKDMPCLWLRSWRISQAGSGAGVGVCGGLHRSRLGMRHSFKCAVPCGWMGRTRARAWFLWAEGAGRARAWVLWGV